MRFLQFLASAVVTSAIGVFGTSASAATVDFSVNKNWTKNSLSFEGSDGTDITASAFLYTSALPNPTFYGDPYIASYAGNAGGIGICSGDKYVSTRTNRTRTCSDNHQIDGNGSNEAVIIDFGDQAVRLLSITFAYATHPYYDSYDNYEVFLQSSDGYNINVPIAQNCWVCEVSNFNVASDTAFAFGAYGSYDDWKLHSLEYERISVAPLPATAWMLLAGIGAFAGVRRRQRKANAA